MISETDSLHTDSSMEESSSNSDSDSSLDMDATLILEHQISEEKIEKVKDKMKSKIRDGENALGLHPENTLEESFKKLKRGIEAVKLNWSDSRVKKVQLSISSDHK